MSNTPNKVYWFIHEKDEKANYVYFIKSGRYLKIGQTQNLITRFNALRFAQPRESYLLGYFKLPLEFKSSIYMNVAHVGGLENRFHEGFLNRKTRGEWFRYDRELLQTLVDHYSGIYNLKFMSEKELPK